MVVHLFPNSPPALTGFPVGVTQGSFTDIWTGLTATNVAALEAGNYYINIHTSAFPGGEVRGLMTVPESSSLTLGAVGAAIVGGAWLLRWARA